MGGKGFSLKLKTYVEKNYKDSKSDLFAVFIERCNEFTKKNCYTSMITMQSWMFLSSFETLRKNIIEKTEIKSLNHLGTRAFSEIGGEVVSTVAWISKKISPQNEGTYIRLVDYNNAELKEQEFFKNANYFQAKQKDFEKIPGSPIAYWVGESFQSLFGIKDKLKTISTLKSGTSTNGKNDEIFRLWYEVEYNKIQFNCYSYKDILKKWLPLAKGGERKKYYGNFLNICDNKFAKNDDLEYEEAISWNDINSSDFSAKKHPKGIIANNVIKRAYIYDKTMFNYILGLMNTKQVNTILKFLIPTLHYDVGYVGNIPILYTENRNKLETVNNLVQQNISISKEEWDSRETSWDFEKLSLIDGKDLKIAYKNYCNHWRDNFVQLHKNEEGLNRLFIEIYELQDEMDEKVSFDDITILKKEAKIVEIDNSKAKEFSIESEKYLYDRGVNLEFNKDELIKQFLSYAVGCIMGRYSTNKSGLIIANSDDILELSENKFIVKGTDEEIRQEVESKFLPDEFAIIPITDEKDFSNDIFEKIKEFIKVVYGEENLKDNLNFIAEALGNEDNKSSEEIIRTYFIKDFYSDHLQRYQKRPIYWLMNSGKKNAFSCLFYMHRYESLTVARVRADYLIPYQEMLENKRKFIERQLSDDDISAKEKKNIEKQLKELDTLLKELREYANEVKHIAEQKIALDLDDGVNVNYERLGAILKKR